jgi:hypothetical protein
MDKTAVYNVVSYVIEWVKLYLVCFPLLGMKAAGKKQTVAGFVSMLVAAVVLAVCFSNQEEMLGFLIGWLAIAGVMIALKRKRKSGFVLLSYICICLFDDMNAIITMSLGIISPKDLEQYDATEQMLEVSLILVLLLAIILKKRLFAEFDVENISPIYVVLLAIGCFALMTYVEFAEIVIFKSGCTGNMKVAAICLCVSGFSFILVAILLLYSLYKKQVLEREMDINDRLLKSQKQYYMNLLRKDEETKGFRHDMQAHLSNMQILLEDEKYKELKAYLAKVHGNFHKIDTNIHTGNRLVDMIVGDLQERYPDVEMKWSGNLPGDLSLPQTELCSVFYNVMNNAVEAASQTEQKTVEIVAKQMEMYLCVTVINCYSVTPVLVNGELTTTKKESGHGYGVKNIQRSLKELGGTYTPEFGDGIFRAEVMLPMVQTEEK